jgi:hypothetical protein
VEDIARKFSPLPNLATACMSDVMVVCGQQAENEVEGMGETWEEDVHLGG